MKVYQIVESTTAGAVASVATPLGSTQKRAGTLFKGKKTKKKFYEGEMKDLTYDIQHLDAGNFMKKYGHPKEYYTSKLGNPPVSEAEINEDDLILVPGHGKKLKPGFIPKDKDRTDHEVEMARSDLYNAAKNAKQVYDMIKNISEEEGIEGWVQEKIIKANDYLNTIREYLEHKTYMQEMSGGVIAGGMSNFEEGKVKIRYEPDLGATTAARPSKIANSRKAIEKYLRNRYGKGEVTIEDYKEYYKPYTYIATHTSKRGDTNSHLIIPDKNGKYGIETIPLSTSGDYPEVYEDKQIDEKKDACYNKVKSRYKVWPSAYASGALVKCRKVGASNWGNKSKK